MTAPGLQTPGVHTPSWPELATAISSCTRCPELVATRQRVVVGQLRQQSRLLLVGEAPGAQEDEVGEPFVGRGGQLLDELLEGAGLHRSQVSVANVLKCRPPANRTPKPAEVANCRSWLTQQLALADPAVVVALGATATGWFFGRGSRLTELRGRPHDVDGRVLVATYHPSAALRFGPKGEPRRLLQADLELAAALLAQGRADA
ncbi:MAG: uracil-DNA glycosylase [Frankiaceae bacterium]|nr:uracil-DNA glycosylase [Frankiaceae bacterium]